jgi:hypothetical protein
MREEEEEKRYARDTGRVTSGIVNKETIGRRTGEQRQGMGGTEDHPGRQQRDGQDVVADRNERWDKEKRKGQTVSVTLRG